MILTLVILLFNSPPTQSKIDWSENYKLKFEDFKGKKKIKNKPIGEIKIDISWNYTQYEGEIPTYIIKNKFDQENSWISMNHNELIKEYQFIWNLQELYVRKARKSISELNKKQILNTIEYDNAIKKQIYILQKQKNRYNGILQNQPDFYRILDKKYQDSINLYANYKQ